MTTNLASMREAYRGRRVLLTGHTGFKGSWLTLWLSSLGAEVSGYALPPEGDRNLFSQAGLLAHCRHIEGDVRNPKDLARIVRELRPEFVFHLAAQSLVLRGYREPLRTYETNVLGTLNVLEAIRNQGMPCAVVIVTSDKCYENDGRTTPYREEDRLGGQDPYSASKAAAEIVVSSYRNAFFHPDRLGQHGVAVATARSGNVIGGGDWSEDRLLPDVVRSLERRYPVPVRNPEHVRPWQHVLDPLSGYLQLATGLVQRTGSRPADFCEAWNFGPESGNSRTVQDVVEETIRSWGSGSWTRTTDENAPHESRHLSLSIQKARLRLGWSPRWEISKAVQRTVEWYKFAAGGAGAEQLADSCLRQIADYCS